MIITIANSKGGVAKSTTAVTLAYALGAQGEDTYLVDCDPQGQSAIMLGFDPAPDLHAWIVDRRPFEALAMLARPQIDNHRLRLLRGDSTSKQADSYLRGKAGGMRDLVNSLRLRVSVPDLPKTLVIDTPASGLLQEAALAAADVLIIPFRCDVLSVDGIEATLGLLKALKHEPRVILLPVAVERRLKEQNYNLGIVTDKYPELVADAVPSRAAVAEAVAWGRTIWEHPARSLDDVRHAYTALVERVLGEVQGE